jgi:hypothetical protein
MNRAGALPYLAADPRPFAGDREGDGKGDAAIRRSGAQ